MAAGMAAQSGRRAVSGMGSQDNTSKPRPFDVGRKRSGKYANPRRPLTAPKEAFELWDHAAEHYGSDWADWARGVLTVAAADELKLDPMEALEVLD
jgi:hypothetical protein